MYAPRLFNLADLTQLVAHVTRKDAPPHYRHLYHMDESDPEMQVASWDEWRSLPFLSKAILQDIPIRDRIFERWQDINSIHASSGTSGRPPHFSPWIRLDGYEYRTRFHTFTRPALSSMPIHHQHDAYLAAAGVTPRLIVFDPRRARVSVELAKLAKVDSLFIFTGHLALIAPEVERLGFGGDIRFIELAGESCTRSLYRYAKRIFPNATIVSFYGATEVENPPITYPCRPLDDTDPLELHHPRAGYYIEIIDPVDGAVLDIKPGVEGEIVLTCDTTPDAHKAVSPLVRYRTGDMAKVVHDVCPDHGTWSFTMPGRVEMDFIKVPGGVLRADEVERVLQALHPMVTDLFELHYREVEHDGKLKPSVTLRLELSHAVDADTVANSIQRQLRIAPTFTYGDGVSMGMFMPLRCENFTPVFRGKRRRLIRES